MPPTATAPKPERDNTQWVKLKTYILNRRNEEIQEKEKEEELAKKRKILEEEYLKAKEELDKVQKEIGEKNQLLKQYTDEKHELFLQLKKVLLDDDNRKRIESEQKDHHLLNNLNHSSQAHIYISQAPPTMSNTIISSIPNSSSIYKLPMSSANAVPSGHPMGNKRTRSPSPHPPNSVSNQAGQLHSYQTYKHASNTGNPMYSPQQLKMSEEQQKHLQISQQQQQQQRHVQPQGSASSGLQHHTQHSNEFIQRNLQRNIMSSWQQQQQQQQHQQISSSQSKQTASYPHYFPPGQHVPTSQYQAASRPGAVDSKPPPTSMYLPHPRPPYDDKYHFAGLRMPGHTSGHSQAPSVPVSKGSITAGYPIPRGMPGRVMVNSGVKYHPQNIHNFIPHSSAGGSK